MQRSPRRVRSTAKDVIKSTARAGAPGCTPGDGVDQTSQQTMNSGLLVFSVLLFVAGVTLISLS